VSAAALEAGKHVLCEKPLGRSAAEARLAVEAAQTHRRVLKTGFNHRHHPAIAEARRRVDAGELGPLFLARCRYGHGGRPGYDREWRADRELAGGGELLDQGVHALDLFRWFLGELVEAYGVVATYFWDMAPLEDNAFALLRTAGGQTASLHASWTQWKNLFSLELVGRDGYLVVEGLGGSYGEETLRVGRRAREGGPPTETVLRFPGEDLSWQAEWEELVHAIGQGQEPLGSGQDGWMALRLVEAIYESSRSGRVVQLGR
jgi:predicted dehydrogenase